MRQEPKWTIEYQLKELKIGYTKTIEWHNGGPKILFDF